MTYSHEVERMCPLTKGPNHGPAPIPEEGQWVKAYRDLGYQRPDARRWLVRAAAGHLQADAEREKGRHRGSAGGDHRLLRHDPFRRHGGRDPARQDHSGGAEHRPCVRRHQRGHARAVPADCLRPQPDRVLRRRPACRRRPGGPGQGPAQHDGHHFLHQGEGRALPGADRGVYHKGRRSTRTARPSATSSSVWAK